MGATIETIPARPITLPRYQADFHQRRFLIVSAPFGPFSTILAGTLEAGGAQVRRMIFNAGDAFDWRRPGGMRFAASPEGWQSGARAILEDYTDILIFGEGGTYNRAVLDLADEIPGRVWVLENGYFRPDWVTIERNGVNGSSRLPRSREGYRSPPPEPSPVRPVGKILPHHVANISLYHLAQMAGAAMFPRYRNYYSVSPWRQCLGHIRRYVALTFSGPAEGAVDLLIQRGPFFIACLQREGDAQLLRYSKYADNTAFLEEVIRSFAVSAPADARLVVKNHPLDPGIVDIKGVTRRLAIQNGLMERVDFIDGGNLARLCRASRGMVVNNSSAALSALGFQTPVKVMGNAFFDFAGLTHQGALNDFWHAPLRPDADLFARFRAHVIARTQVNGNYHEPSALKPTAAGVVAMFQRD